MTFDYADNNSLLQKARTEKLFDKLVVQLGKDFGLANIPIDLPAGISPEKVSEVLLEKIYVLLMENFSACLNLLYVIDVPEKAFKEIEVTDVVEVAGQVSFLILKKELQKVMLRRKYDV